MRVNLLLLSGFILVLATGAFHTASTQDSAALVRQNQQLLEAQDSLTTVIEHYRTINEKYYELAKESRSVTTWTWSAVGIGSIIALVFTLWRVYAHASKTARTEVAKLVKLNQRSFDGIIALYGNHYDYLKNKTIWVVEPHESSNDEKSVARFLRKLGFDKVESVYTDNFSGYLGKSNKRSIARFLRKLGFNKAKSIHPNSLSSYSEKPDMILLNNEEQAIQESTGRNPTDLDQQHIERYIQVRNTISAKAILFWYDTNGIRFPTNIEKSNYANSRYTLYNNIIESFRVHDVER